jgi:hypothetical protein
LALVAWLAFGVGVGCEDRGELDDQEDSILCEEAVAHLEDCCGLELRVSCVRHPRLPDRIESAGCAYPGSDHPCTDGPCYSEPLELPDISPDASRCWRALECDEIRASGDCETLRDEGYASVECP